MDKITVQTGVTKNLGNYESLRLDAHYETSVKEDETVEQAYARAWQVIEAQVDAQLSSYED
jgi:hypothetical protein